MGVVLAMLFMVLLGAIPRRYWYIQLPAVLGWVLVWTDGECEPQASERRGRRRRDHRSRGECGLARR